MARTYISLVVLPGRKPDLLKYLIVLAFKITVDVSRVYFSGLFHQLHLQFLCLWLLQFIS